MSRRNGAHSAAEKTQAVYLWFAGEPAHEITRRTGIHSGQLWSLVAAHEAKVDQALSELRELFT